MHASMLLLSKLENIIILTVKDHDLFHQSVYAANHPHTHHTHTHMPMTRGSLCGGVPPQHFKFIDHLLVLNLAFQK